MIKSFLIALSLAVPVAAAPLAQAQDQSSPPSHAGQPVKKHERHAEMRRALHALENAKRDLDKAAHDFQGHRAKALELTDQAIGEVKAGLAADKK